MTISCITLTTISKLTPPVRTRSGIPEQVKTAEAQNMFWTACFDLFYNTCFGLFWNMFWTACLKIQNMFQAVCFNLFLLTKQATQNMFRHVLNKEPKTCLNMFQACYHLKK